MFMNMSSLLFHIPEHYISDNCVDLSDHVVVLTGKLLLCCFVDDIYLV